MTTAPPSRCLRCRRPVALCYCAGLVPVPTPTRVVILQHPRERTKKMGTGRLAHLGLANSELHVGVRLDDHPRVRALADDRGAALLYPSRDAVGVDTLRAPPATLVVLDGTWFTAPKMLAQSRLLARLPRLALVPAVPSAYRIRREPAPHCLSTVEAVVAALGALEGDTGRFAPLLRAFDALVTSQLHRAAIARVPYRHERKHRRRHESAVELLLRERAGDVVLAQAEGNPHADAGPHELVQLVALRPASGERFAAIVRPRWPLAPRTPARLGVDALRLHAGSDIGEARGCWETFLRPRDVLVGWGCFTPAVLAAEGLAVRPWVDLRGEVARRLGRRARGVADAAARLAPDEEGSLATPERALVRLTALLRVTAALRRHHWCPDRKHAKRAP